LNHPKDYVKAAAFNDKPPIEPEDFVVTYK
jgi:hypothetical protein